jgi:hypothetical protein
VAQVPDQRAGDAPRVEADVVIELAILDGDEGGRHVFGQGVQVDRRRVLAAAHGQQGAGAVQIVDRGLALDVVQLGRVGQVAGEHREEGDDEDQTPDAEHDRPVQQRLKRRALRLRRLVPAEGAVGHVVLIPKGADVPRSRRNPFSRSSQNARQD